MSRQFNNYTYLNYTIWNVICQYFFYPCSPSEPYFRQDQGSRGEGGGGGGPNKVCHRLRMQQRVWWWCTGNTVTWFDTALISWVRVTRWICVIDAVIPHCSIHPQLNKQSWQSGQGGQMVQSWKKIKRLSLHRVALDNWACNCQLCISVKAEININHQYDILKWEWYA